MNSGHTHAHSHGHTHGHGHASGAKLQHDVSELTASGSLLELSSRSAGAAPIASPNSKQYRLKLQPQPPKFPFKNAFFEVNVYLLDENENLKTGPLVPIDVKLLYDDLTPVDNPHDAFEIVPTKPTIQRKGLVQIHVRMKQVSMNYENRSFRLQFSVADDSIAVEPVISTPMTVIRHRLVISQQPPPVWYKDEGGKDKCITMQAVLLDENEQPVRDREVPLKMSLLYESGTPVSTQGILKLNSPKPVIGNTGSVTLRLRIEEVSKNHQNQAFTIKLEPDPSFSPINLDISSDVSTPIAVRSKRNKKNLKRKFSPGRADLTDSETGGHGHAGYSGSGPSPTKQAMVATVPPAQAVRSVWNWCNDVVQGLRKLEWQLVGYEFDGTGALENRPLHRCPSCWMYKDTHKAVQHYPTCMIMKALRSWESDVDHQVQSLAASLDSGDAAPILDHANGAAGAGHAGTPTVYNDEKETYGFQQQPGSFSFPAEILDPNQLPHLSSGFMSEDAIGFLGDPVEGQVYAVLVLEFEKLGFPAFDQAGSLVGLYRYNTEPLGLHFINIDRYPNLGPEKRQEIVDLYRKQSGSYMVKTLAECFNLDKLKEEVLLLHWQLKGTSSNEVAEDNSLSFFVPNM